MKTNKFLKYIISPVFMVVFCFFLTPTASAKFQDLPSVLPDTGTDTYLRLSTKPDEGDTGANDYAEELSILVYKNNAVTPGEVKLQFNSGDSCQYKDITFSSIGAKDSGIKTSPYGSWVGDGSIDRSQGTPYKSTTLRDPCNSNITIPKESFIDSYKFDGSTIKVAILKIRLPTPDSVFTFNITKSTETAGKIGLSTVGSGDANKNNLPRSHGTLLKIRYGGKKVEARFGVPCGYSGAAKIFWKGADSNKPVNNYKPVSVNISRDSARQSNFWSIPDAWAGSNVHESDPLPMIAGDTFTVTFDGIENPNNAILLWLPFDSAEYDKGGCDETPDPDPRTWTAEWGDNYIVDSGGDVRSDRNNNAGNLAYPDDEFAPRPGENLTFVHKALNNVNSERTITNLRWSKICNKDKDAVNKGGQCHGAGNGSPNDDWYLSTGYSSEPLNMEYSPYSVYGDNVPAQYKSNTQNVAVSSTHSATQTVGKDTPAGSELYGYDASDPVVAANPHRLLASDGGRTICSQRAITPSIGTATVANIDKDGDGTVESSENNQTVGWATSGSATSPNLCVRVPFYYNLTPSVTITGTQGGTVQQGTSPDIEANISQTGATNGRNNTYSEAGKEKGLVQLLLAPGEAEPINKTAEALSTSAPMVWCAARSDNNADCTTPYTSTNAVGVPGSPLGASLTGTLNPNTDTLPVGTKLCYATYAQHPRNINNDDYRNGDGQYSYSDIQCAIIVKSPKVQFLNTDVTVGRQSSAMAQCSESQVLDAPIITSGSPENRSPSNLYGSWVEYGAFATGKITNFGSAAVPFGITNEPRKLTFGNNDFNTTGDLGGFVYGKNCVADFFSMVKEDNTNLMLLGSSVFDQGTGVLDLQQLGAGTDKTGYVATDKNIQLGEPTTGQPNTDTTPSPTTQTIVRVSARAQSDVGNNGCPKLLVKVTDGGGNVDQDVKTICATGFQDYEYVFYQDTGGPKRVETRFINDGIVANVDRNIVLRTINVNGQDTYLSNRSSNPGSSIIGGGTSCVNSGNLYLFRSVSEGDPAINCFGVLINPVTAPLPPAQQQADYAPPEETTVIVTARATLASSPDGTSSVPSGCPYMFVRVVGTNGIVREHTQAVCSTSQSPYSFTVNLGGGGVASVDASYDPMDYYGGGQDRNLYISNIRVGTTSIPINANSGANVQLKHGTGAFVPISAAPAACADSSTVIFLSATNNVTNTGCATVRVSNVTAPVPVPSPPGSLTSDYDGFKGRSIVIYAKKTSAGDCTSTSNGNITINKDLIYKKDGFASVLDIPRITIMADCNITIADNVVEVNANLIARDAIKTCTNKAETQDKCNQKLTVRGGISANRLLLWRTYGADNSPGAPDPKFPAETFDLSPSQIISGYSRGARSATPTTVYEVDLPPRY